MASLMQTQQQPPSGLMQWLGRGVESMVTPILSAFQSLPSTFFDVRQPLDPSADPVARDWGPRGELSGTRLPQGYAKHPTTGLIYSVDESTDRLGRLGSAAGLMAGGFMDPLGGAATALMAAPRLLDPVVASPNVVAANAARAGKLRGAPPGITTPSRLKGLTKRMMDRTMEGAPLKDWYEEGAEAVHAASGQRPEATEKFFELGSLYSPQRRVPDNVNDAIGAYNQALAGDPVRGFGFFHNVMSEGAEGLLQGGNLTGRKRGNFLTDHMQYIRPGSKDYGHTVDIWDMRSGEFVEPGTLGPFKGTPTPAQYDFMEQQGAAVTDAINRNPAFLEELDVTKLTPTQTQAMRWGSTKVRYEKGLPPARKEALERGYIEKVPDGKGKFRYEVRDPQNWSRTWQKYVRAYTPSAEELQDASFHFGTGLNRAYAQQSYETIPGLTSGHLPEMFDAPMEARQAYHEAVNRVLLDPQGRDLINDAFGLLTGQSVHAPGAFQGATNPGTQALAAVAKAKGEGVWEVEASSRKLLEAAELTRGLLLRQDAVAWHRPFVPKTPIRLADRNFAAVDIGRTLADAETVRLYNAILEELPKAGGMLPPIGSARGARFYNFDTTVTGVDNKKFQKAVNRAVQKAFPGDQDVGIMQGSADGYFLQNDWIEAPNGEHYNAALERLGPDLAERAHQLQSVLGPEIEKVSRGFADRAGWTYRPPGSGGNLQRLTKARRQSVLAPRYPWAGGGSRGLLQPGGP